MPTIAGLVADGKVIATPAPTDLLWANQGTGSDRDKAITSQQVVEGGFPAAVAGFPAPTAPNGTETFPVIQAGVGKEISLKDALAVAGSNVAEISGIATADLVSVKEGVGYRIPAESVFPLAVDISKLTASEASWTAINAGAAVDFSDAIDGTGFERGHLVIKRTPPVLLGGTSGEFLISVRALLKGYAASASNANYATLSIPSAALPTGWFAEIDSVVESLIGGYEFPFLYEANDSETSVQGICYMTTSATTLDISFNVPWSTIMPTNSTAGALIQGQFSILTDSALPASL